MLAGGALPRLPDPQDQILIGQLQHEIKSFLSVGTKLLYSHKNIMCKKLINNAANLQRRPMINISFDQNQNLNRFLSFVWSTGHQIPQTAVE